MKLMPWRKREGDVALHRDDDELWNRFLEAFHPPFTSPEFRLANLFRASSFPPVNVSESENDYTVAVEVPGMTEQDLDIEVMGDQLVIAGERKWESQEKADDKEFHRVESRYGSFQRTLPLPGGLQTDTDSVRATFENGILSIVFQKVEPTPKRKIAITKG